MKKIVLVTTLAIFITVHSANAQQATNFNMNTSINSQIQLSDESNKFNILKNTQPQLADLGYKSLSIPYLYKSNYSDTPYLIWDDNINNFYFISPRIPVESILKYNKINNYVPTANILNQMCQNWEAIDSKKLLEATIISSTVKKYKSDPNFKKIDKLSNMTLSDIALSSDKFKARYLYEQSYRNQVNEALLKLQNEYTKSKNITIANTINNLRTKSIALETLKATPIIQNIQQFTSPQNITNTAPINNYSQNINQGLNNFIQQSTIPQATTGIMNNLIPQSYDTQTQTQVTEPNVFQQSLDMLNTINNVKQQIKSQVGVNGAVIVPKADKLDKVMNILNMFNQNTTNNSMYLPNNPYMYNNTNGIINR
ncbi:MAG: hypothetical protein WCK67_05005 [bacterium]